MVNFDKVNEYIEYIEKGEIPEGMSFNEFAIDFFEASRVIPLSKYLRNIGKTSKMPKIMNTKKLGEILLDTEKSGEELHTFLKRKGFDKVPELNYTIAMLVRKVDLLENWKKIIIYLTSDKTVTEINSSTKQILLPGEVKKLEEFVMNELNLNDEKFNTLFINYKKIMENKEIKKALNKLIRQG